jgi:hypothetical protein
MDFFDELGGKIHLISFSMGMQAYMGGARDEMVSTGHNAYIAT